MQDGVLVRFLDGLLLAGLLGLDQLDLVQLRVDAQRLQLVPGQPLPRSFGVEEQDEVMRRRVAEIKS